MSKRHPEVAEPQPNRSMQNLNCHPELVSGSSHRDDEGSPLTPTLSRRARGKKAAFTLAEVLITLAIIGVVAAMTIPSLVQNYKKRVVEVKLSKFNSMMQQVIRLSSIENGGTSVWDTSNFENFYKTYLSPYIKVLRTEMPDDNHFYIYFSDGTRLDLFKPDNATTIHANYYTDSKTSVLGKNLFLFLFYKTAKNGWEYKSGSYFCNSPYIGNEIGFVPYFYYDTDATYDENKGCYNINYPTQNELKNSLINNPYYGCATGGHYCTKLIQLNNWKIPDDYPFKF